eukprot:GAHX01000287.1.p1 GENE.GAHX01000287.1~~GAHX01000287.1.p1  ORF type:complete len:165 (+),score=40.94 GAHX01000287.1:56-550(+)
MKKEEDVFCNDLYDTAEVGCILDEELFNHLSNNKYQITNIRSNLHSLINIGMVAIAILLFAKTPRLDLHRNLMFKLLAAFGGLYVLNYLFEKFLIKNSLVRIKDKESYSINTQTMSEPIYKYIIEKEANGVVKSVGELKVEELFYFSGKLRKDILKKKLNKLKL